MLRRAFLKALAIIGVATVTPAVPDDKLTEEQFNEFLEMAFQYGNSKKYMVLSPQAAKFMTVGVDSDSTLIVTRGDSLESVPTNESIEWK